MCDDYTTVTEVSGIRASGEQLAMLYTRYRYAATFCEGKNVLEVACGAGLGLGYLAKGARLVVGGDRTTGLLDKARRYYGDGVPLVSLDAQALPIASDSFDAVILYEAIYYLRDPERFLVECRRVLRSKGVLLLCTVNKEWSDFNPSPFSTKYFSASDLRALLQQHQFQVELYGGFPAGSESIGAALVSFLKRAAVALHLVPKTMKGKELLKRVFFGKLSSLPPEVVDGMATYCPPRPLPIDANASSYKVLYAVGRIDC